MRCLIISDVHGNLSALDAVLVDAEHRYHPDTMMLLGDSIDYGMRSNEVIERMSSLSIPIVCSVWGNHEASILQQRFDRFSTHRGEESARFTASRLTDRACAWLMKLGGESGMRTFACHGYRILVVHGSIADPLWGTIGPVSTDHESYKDYDMVFSGHSHIPHMFDILVPEVGSPLRGKRVIRFINPGSVGQPRNHDPRASYAIWDTERGVCLEAVRYDVEYEQSFYDGSIDDFYRTRLAQGV